MYRTNILAPLLGWLAVNGIIVGAQVFAAATSWAFGSLLLLLTPWLADELWAWCVVGVLMLAAGNAFCFWVVGFAHGRSKALHRRRTAT